MESQLNFEIVFRAPLGEIYSDISYLSFIRTPLLKNCSYVIMRINLTPILIQQIINDLNNNIFEDFKIEIYSINETNKNPSVIVFNKLFKVLYAKCLEPLKFDKSLYPCYLILSNPFFHYMSTANTFNNILESKTGYDAIKDFETSIQKTHGKIFKSRHIGTNSEINSYIYEQILVKTKNDLDVPTYIINTYKPFNSFNFYFFDDFYITDDSDTEIACHYINIHNTNNLKNFDVSEYADITVSSTKLHAIPISDQFLKLDKEDQTITILNREAKYNTQKSFKSKLPKHSSISKLNETAIIENRNMQVGEYISPIQKTSTSTPSQHVNIYAPDDSDSAILRFNKFKDFFLKKIDSIQIYETTNCLPDWCQFGRVYNLDKDDPSSFVYTPMNIVNMFVRNNLKEHYCSHVVRYSMLKFINEDVDYSFWKTRSI
jgi:hypothetical protein